MNYLVLLETVVPASSDRRFCAFGTLGFCAKRFLQMDFNGPVKKLDGQPGQSLIYLHLLASFFGKQIVLRGDIEHYLLCLFALQSVGN
jgi:hypothetical protein